MTQELFVVAVDLGGFTVPMLVPYSDIRCPASGAEVDHVASGSPSSDPEPRESTTQD